MGTDKTEDIRQLFTIQPPGSTHLSSYLSLSKSPVSSSLKFCSRSVLYAAPAIWTPKSLLIIPTGPLISALIRLHSSLSYLPLVTENWTFKLSYRDLTPAPPEIRYFRHLVYRFALRWIISNILFLISATCSVSAWKLVVYQWHCIMSLSINDNFYAKYKSI